ncbi:MAG: FAD-dependent oxidoreductase [Clostridiales bacterium]|nr:FAD-dependent oxidoreductase [Clostridiales bacterium]
MSHVFDVAIIGAGPSGIAAAMYAAQNGVQTVLIEKDSVIGGSALKAQIHTIKGHIDASSRIFLDGIIKKAWNQNIFHPEELIDRYYSLLEKSGTQVLCDHEVISIDVKENAIASVMCLTPSGKKLVSAKVFIDASGISIVEHLTGQNDFTGEKKCYMTAFIGKVETIGGRCYSKEAQQLLQDNVTSAKKKGELDYDIGINILPTVRGDIALLVVSDKDVDKDMGKVMRIQTQKAMKFLQAFGFGFENASIIGTTKNVFYDVNHTSKAKYLLSYDDIVSQKEFDNYVVTQTDENNTTHFSIPYDALVSSIYHNLLLCGKNIGMHMNVVELINGIALHLATGKAAGVAAAIAAKKNIHPGNVVVYEVQAQIEEDYDASPQLAAKIEAVPSSQSAPDGAFIENVKEWEDQYTSPLHQAAISLNRNSHSKAKKADSFETLDWALRLIDEKNDGVREMPPSKQEEIIDRVEDETHIMQVPPVEDKEDQAELLSDINDVLGIDDDLYVQSDSEIQKASVEITDITQEPDTYETVIQPLEKVQESIEPEEDDFIDLPSDIEERPSDIEDRPSDIEDLPSDDLEEDSEDKKSYGRFYDDMFQFNDPNEDIEELKKEVFKDEGEKIITQSDDIISMMYADDEDESLQKDESNASQDTLDTNTDEENQSELDKDISFMEHLVDQHESIANEDDYFTVYEPYNKRSERAGNQEPPIDKKKNLEDENPRTYLMPSEILGGLPNFTSSEDEEESTKKDIDDGEAT